MDEDDRDEEGDEDLDFGEETGSEDTSDTDDGLRDMETGGEPDEAWNVEGDEEEGEEDVLVEEDVDEDDDEGEKQLKPRLPIIRRNLLNVVKSRREAS
ncbi:hypothetical protein V5O48_018594 [Marasmius crinis-equi]|uniref:Uncharacterized protein n=1 Tax=Marasmius crinis-equi TaxID=585013 RepID=A0ABR3EKQ6_9AGAR